MVYSFSIHIRDRRGKAVPIFHRLFIELDERYVAPDDGERMTNNFDDFISASIVSSSILHGQLLETMTEDTSDTQSVRSLESDAMSTVSTLQMTSEMGLNLPSSVTRYILPLRSPALLSIIDDVQSQCNFALAVNSKRPKKFPGQITSATSIQQTVSASESASIAAVESLDFGVCSTTFQHPNGSEMNVRALWLYGFNMCFLVVCDEEENPLAAKAALKLIAQKCQEHLRLFNKPLSAIYRIESLHFIVKSVLKDGVLRFTNTKALKMLDKEIERGMRQFAKP